jgi:hypothetical protein
VPVVQESPTTSAPRAGRALGALGLGILVLAWWWHAFTTGEGPLAAVNLDIVFYFYPTYEAAARWLARGALPLWNPYQLCGLPWFASPITGFAYPPHLLYALLPTHVALAVLAALHLLLIAGTTVALGRRLGLGCAGAVLATLFFTLHASTDVLMRTPVYLESAAWLPLGCLAVEGIVRRRRLRGAFLLAVAMGASWLAAYAQITLYLVYAWASLLLALLLADGRDVRTWLANTAAFTGGLLLGTLVSAIQLLPAIEAARVGVRAAGPLTTAQMLPLGNPGPRMLGLVAGGRPWVFAALGLALVPALVAFRPRAVVVWALGIGLLAAAFTLGPLSPLFPVYLALPPLARFRAPWRVFFLVEFCVAILAGAAVAALARGESRRHRLALWVPLACCLGIAGILLASRPRLPGLFAAASAGVLALAAWSERWRTQAGPWALVAIVAVGLWVAAPREFPLPYDAASAARFRRYERTYTMLAGVDRAWIFPYFFADPGLAPRVASFFRVRSLDDYEPMSLRRQAEYLTYFMEGATTTASRSLFFQGAVISLRSPPGRPPPATRRRLLDLAAVRFVVMPTHILEHPEVRAFLDAADLDRREAPDPGLALFENPHALPRAFVVHRVAPAPPAEQLLPLLADARFDPLEQSYTEVDPGFANTPEAPRGGPATIVRDEDRSVEIEVTAAAPGLVVLADTFYPGWQATVDGQPAPILATNHLFRGVAIPAGHHRVRFEYRPRSVALGAAISLVAVVATVAGLALSPV